MHPINQYVLLATYVVTFAFIFYYRVYRRRSGVLRGFIWALTWPLWSIYIILTGRVEFVHRNK